MLLQALIQYDDRRDSVGVNLRFSLLQQANSGLFLVYNEVDEEGLRGPESGDCVEVQLYLRRVALRRHAGVATSCGVLSEDRPRISGHLRAAWALANETGRVWMGGKWHS